MKLNRIELEQSVIYQIQKDVKAKFGVYIEYDKLEKIAKAQFSFLKYGIENNINKINLISVCTFKRNYLKQRIKDIKTEYINSGIDADKAGELAKDFVLTQTKDINISNSKIRKKRIDKTIHIDL